VLGVVSKVRDRIIDLTAQQKLAVIQTGNFVFIIPLCHLR